MLPLAGTELSMSYSRLGWGETVYFFFFLGGYVFGNVGFMYRRVCVCVCVGCECQQSGPQVYASLSNIISSQSANVYSVFFLCFLTKDDIKRANGFFLLCL